MDLLSTFENDCRLRGLDPKTIKTYKVYLIPFIEFAQTNDPQTGLWEYLSERYENDQTRKAALRHIKAYIHRLSELGLCEDWAAKIKFKFPPPSQTPAISEDEFKAIMKAIPGTMRGRRDRALFTALFYTGARRGGIITIRRANLCIKDRMVKIKTKGRKEQILTIPAQAAIELNAWMAMSEKIGSPWLFPSTRHPEKHIDQSYVTHALPRYARAAGFDRRVYVHLLRGSFATILHEHDVPIETIQAALGHVNIETTIGYVRRLADAQKVRRASDRVFGVGGGG